MSGKFIVFAGKNGQTFSLKSGHGGIILKSEGHRDKASAHNGIESVRKNAPDAKLVEERAILRRGPWDAPEPLRSASADQRISVDLPNSDSTRSTASLAVWLRLSKAGFSSTMSSDATRPVSASISMHSCASR